MILVYKNKPLFTGTEEECGNFLYNIWVDYREKNKLDSYEKFTMYIKDVRFTRDIREWHKLVVNQIIWHRRVVEDKPRKKFRSHTYRRGYTELRDNDIRMDTYLNEFGGW